VTAGSAFDAATAGTVRGRVTWQGALPSVPPFEIRSFLLAGEPGMDRLIRENPNAPEIDPATRGVGNAVVFLRHVDARKGRPWHHPPLRVEHRDRRLHVVQGDCDSRVGFGRRGEEVEIVSREKAFNSLSASGAAFFTLALPDPDRPRRRRLSAGGLVELSSGAGHYWMRAYLFVDEHPYYARTDKHGRFQLDEVPPGRYEVVCWMPSWQVERQERDPETSLVVRHFFRPPVEQRRQVTVEAGSGAALDFAASQGMFEAAAPRR
jgi:hypothetical protein